MFAALTATAAEAEERLTAEFAPEEAYALPDNACFLLVKRLKPAILPLLPEFIQSILTEPEQSARLTLIAI